MRIEFKDQSLKTLRAAQAILEWLEVANTDTTAMLATNSFGATIASNDTFDTVELYGIEAQTDQGLNAALKEWSHRALRTLGKSGESGLVEFFAAFEKSKDFRFHSIVLHCAKAGVGSWIDPSAPARRITSSFYELEMFGVMGRGHTSSDAIQCWIDAAQAVLTGIVAQEAA